MMTEKEKMLAGKLYDPTDEALTALRLKAHRLSKDYNALYEEDVQARRGILEALVPGLGRGSELLAPVFFDYGVFTTVGENCMFNFNLTVLDCCPVTIGNNVFVGPSCSILTPVHPLLAEERNIRFRADGTAYDLEYAKPVTIGDDCWLGGNVTVCGGVTIGAGTVIGAGSVVVRDIPDGVLAAGNPCRVIRKLTEADRMMGHFSGGQ